MERAVSQNRRLVAPMAFGGVVAKQSQDDKPPRVVRGSVRTASVNYGLRSQSSLRSRSGMKASRTWPLLARLSFAPFITARPFGLGCRFDETPSGNGIPYGNSRARSFKPSPRKQARVTTSNQRLQGPITSCINGSADDAVSPFRSSVVSRTHSSPGAPQARSGAFTSPAHCRAYPDTSPTQARG